VPEALRRLGDERLVLVQSGLFPHAGYDERFRLLTPATLDDPGHAAAVVLFAPKVGAYPFKASSLAESLSDLAPALPPGLFAARLPDPSNPCGGGHGEPLGPRIQRSRRLRCR
jgi:hypothetical protein